MSAQAEKVVQVVLEELKDRRGIGQELQYVLNNEPEIWKELVGTLEKKVDEANTEREIEITKLETRYAACLEVLRRQKEPVDRDQEKS